ncbi:MAG: hypothetical protein WCG85_04945 [Polyangia bacterium]
MSVRLVTALRRAGVAVGLANSRGAQRPRAQGICWGEPPETVDPETLRPGQHVVTDVEVVDICGGHYTDEGNWIVPVLSLARRERVTADSGERGAVTLAGEVIGEVVEVVGRVINIQYFDGRSPLDPPHSNQAV